MNIDKQSGESSPADTLVAQLLEALQSEDHKRLVRAYRMPDALPALERELVLLVREIIEDAN